MQRDKRPLSHRFLEAVLLVLLALLLPVLLPLGFLILFLILLYKVALHILVWILWLPRGKNVLVISSESPVWQDYMNTQIIPLVRGRAIVLNWSERKKWSRWSLPVRVFHSLGGQHEFNPLVIVFRPLWPARVFRFWSAFKDWKHGETQAVDKLREKLIHTL